MSDLNSLKNDGVLALRKPPQPALEKTAVVLGTARGGTTMVASVLQALGVPMGKNLGPVLEDVALSEAVEARDSKRFQEIVAQRNSEYPIWGWKRPAALEYSDVWRVGFRNPYIIAVFRDPFAIANRNRISMLSDVFQNMEQSIQHLNKLVQFLRAQEVPILMCSYEKVLASPENFVRAVDDFLDLNAKELWETAVSQINPGSREYLETSRITHSLGHLDIVNREVCAGWAFYPKMPKRCAQVEIWLNDQLVDTVAAKAMRLDLKEKGVHPTGHCGFKFPWPEGVALKEGDRIQAKVEGDTKPLVGSPKVFVQPNKDLAGSQKRSKSEH